MSAVSDEELVRAIQRGDTNSLGALVTRWEEPLFRFVYRHLPRSDEASDVCQETFLRILRRSDRYRPGARFSTWMYQIALNLCRDRLRKRRRWRRIVDERTPVDTRLLAAVVADAPDGSPERCAERTETAAAVRSALVELPAEQREVLVLKEYEGLKFREIAELLGCPESTVKSRMVYGLRGLRQALARRGLCPRRNP